MKWLLITTLVLLAVPVYAVTDAVNVTATVNFCNNNGSCEGSIGETVDNCPNDCHGGGGGGGDTALQIINVASVPATSSATISWETNLSAYSTLTWGQTLSYELGSRAELTPASVHSMLLTGLIPDTTYYFKIDAVDANDPTNVATSTDNTFRTLPLTDSPPGNPINFRAVYSAPDHGIALTWNNPTDIDFSNVRLMRSTTFFPGSPTEGTLIYEGSDENFLDLDVLPGVTYYYTLFAKDTGGNYSSGVVDSASVPNEAQECQGTNCPCVGTNCPCTGAACVDNTHHEGSTTEEVLNQLPVAQEIPADMKLEFKVTQNSKVNAFRNDSRVDLDSDHNLRISIDYDNLPEVLKTIVVTMKHPKDPTKIFSFLLRANPEKTEFSADLSPLLDPGEYEVHIYVIDHKNEKLGIVKGALIVAAPPRTNIITSIVPSSLLPIGQAIGVISGVVETIIVTTNASSIYEVYLLIARFFGALLGILGFRRRHRPWGTVYDSVTKRPLDPAYVVVKSKGSQVADAITDLDGRYGFLLPGGAYMLEAGKTNYTFPSKHLAGQDFDELYANLYHGEELSTSEGEVITRNIPLDPVGFDWNEFVKSKQELFRVYSRRERIKSIIFDALYLFGFIFTLFATFITPSVLNFSILGFYVVIFLFQTYWRANSRAVTIKDADTGEPYSFAIVRVFLSNLNQEVKKIVADQFGRFYLLVSPGKYYITIDAKQPDASYRRVYRSGELELKKGVIGEDILIGKANVRAGEFAMSKQ